MKPEKTQTEPKAEVLVNRKRFTDVVRHLIATPPIPKAAISEKIAKKVRPKARSKAKPSPAD